jgi:predicted phage terminase large subunit-like protein
LNVLRKKLAFPDLERAVHEQHRMFNPSVILIEDKASGTQLIQQLVEAGLSKVTRYKPDGDKIMRLHAQTATIENGFVHLPRNAHWLADYLHELTVFPNGRHDDQVDSTSQALAWSKQRPPGWGIQEYYRELAEGRRREYVQTLVKIEGAVRSHTRHDPHRTDGRRRPRSHDRSHGRRSKVPARRRLCRCLAALRARADRVLTCQCPRTQ